MQGCLINELFSCTKLSGTEELRNTASIPKVSTSRLSVSLNSYSCSQIEFIKTSGEWRDVRSKAFQAVDQFLQIVKQHHEKRSTGDTSTTSMGTSSIPGNAGLLGWAMSSLTLTGVSDASSNLLLILVSSNHIVVDSASIKPVHRSSGVDVADHPVPVSPTSTDGWGELENGIHEAAQRRSVSQPKPQGTGLRGKTTPKMSKDGDEDLWGSVAVPAPRATSQPSSSRANRTVDDDDPWAAIAAPAPSAKPLNVKRSGAPLGCHSRSSSFGKAFECEKKWST
ncbi:hypothetical protein K7X08_035587 [Anisodus acutangulus]|uniref:Uncharacterized protein n=1 Tax=Anisodus acutangulus TaxID=402998 RepID=A0A9Q1LJE2_9SOLA|nr:hypothetical protein K7X08_035587 [Anisodus acutangulus]